jgi:hypothetical protein
MSALCAEIRRILILFFLISMVVNIAWGGDYKVRRAMEGYTLNIALNQNPPILGKNEIRIEIKDARGQFVVNAPVTINYYMPPMPNMPPMNYAVKASPRGSGYTATLDFIMTGPWNIIIKANTADKPLRMTVPIDIR